MSTQPLYIAWMGPGPSSGGGVGGVATQLLGGLAKHGHRVDCFLPGRERPLPESLVGLPNLTFIWGTADWQWDRWYSRTRLTAFASGLIARSLSLLRLRRQIAERHARSPYDVIYQFSTIENIGVPSRLTRTVPLVIHPETHAAGELRFLIAERRLSLRCQPAYVFAAVLAILTVRTMLQRLRIRRATLLVCISSVFRDHLVHDYRFPLSSTVVIPNPVDVDRFAALGGPLHDPPTVLVLGRIAVRKGVDDVVALAHELHSRGSRTRLRVVGGPSLWTDYTKLLEDLPAENADYVGVIDAAEVPGELTRCDVLLQPSRYEPFALTVAEALAAGMPVVATSEVGATENVDRSVAAIVAPRDVDAMASAIEALIADLGRDPASLRATARSEAERLFAPEIVCEQISASLEGLVAGQSGAAQAGDRLT